MMLPRLLLLCCLLLSGPALAEDAPALSSGQSLYLPIYSHVYHGDPSNGGKPSQSLLSAHVSIRNTDSRVPIQVLSARYYDTDGKLVKNYVGSPRTVAPYGTLELFVPHTDSSGGSGANFIVEWKSDSPANPPRVEALHADIRASRTMVFITSAHPVIGR
ncbi:MAG TPA: DUF3124 domain-containing protein [Rhodocyclaceae bacterium]